MTPENPLDNIAWSSLTNNHRHLGTVGKKAALYNPQISMIAALKEETPEAFTELATLATPRIPVALVGYNAPENHQDWNVIRTAEVLQMTLGSAIEYEEMKFETLTASDVPEMLKLVELTQPGPFSPRTIEMGRYIGLKVDGKLVAMGGERMRPVGYVEVSAVCTHPDFRGKGIAKAITGELSIDILDRGLVPVLHVFGGNDPAIRLYEKLGYVYRKTVPGAAMMKKPTS